MNNYIKEPKGVDFFVESKEWTPEEIAEMRSIIQQRKAQIAKNRNALQRKPIRARA